MALPVPESAASPREDIIRLLAGTPEGLSDSEIAAALGDRYPGLNPKAVNHQCRRLVVSGAVERVGTRPVRTKLAAGVEVPEVAPEPAPEGDTTPSDQGFEAPTPDAAPTLTPIQRDILAALADEPAGLTDNELAAVLAERHPEVDPKAFNYQCRKLAKAGLVERSARSRDVPIRTRLTAAGAERHTTPPEPTPDRPGVPLDPAEAPAPQPAPDQGHTTPVEPAPDRPDVPLDEPEPALVGAPSRRPRRRAKAPADDVARMRRSERDDWAPDDPDEPLLRFLPFAPAATARTALRERMAERAALRRVPEPSDEIVLPTRDVLQGWSRTQNVAAAVAAWLTRRGSTIRAARASGPAHELVATLDGDDVHVEVTGWPPDGARSHPTTLAGDWFRAAARAASQRRRAHPRGRVVIALPDTRRYRALADDGAEVLRGARAEVWFVDPAGDVQLS
jgi:Fe-S-cluster formation regulator IscX/YfhJ